MSAANLLRLASIKASHRRFDAEPLTGFGALLPTDSLTARLESIWNLKPSAIEVSVGYIHPLDDSILDWNKTVMTRAQAAKALREARSNGLLIEQGRTGYFISGVLHPFWEYA